MRQLQIFFATISLLLLLHTPAVAQYNSLSLEDCRKLALENNFNLKSSSENISASEDMLAAYKTNYLPNFSISANYIYSTASYEATTPEMYLPTFVPDATTGELVANVAGVGADGSTIFNQYAYMPSFDLDLQVGSLFNAGAQATQAIYLGGKVSTSVKLANIGVEVAKLNSELTESEVIVAVDEAFFTYIKLQELVSSATKYQEAVEEFYRQINNALNVGMTRRNELLKVEVRLNEAKLMSYKAQNGLRLARMNLCYALGIPITTLDITLVDQFDMNKLINSSDLDITSRPEYELLQKKIEAKELEIKLKKSDFLPSLTALASYGYLQGGKLNGSTLISGSGFTGGVSLSVPIFHWGEGRRKVSASRREVEIAKNQFEDLSQKMTLELQQAINSYEEAIMEVQLMNNSVEQAEENMRLSKNNYDTGMENIADYLESQALWQKAMSDLVEARASQRLSYTKYLKASGKEL